MIRSLLQRLTLPLVLSYALIAALLVVAFALRPVGNAAGDGAGAGGLDLGLLAPPAPDYQASVSRLRAAGFFALDASAAAQGGEAEDETPEGLPRFASVVSTPEGGIYALVRSEGGLQRIVEGERIGDFTLVSLDATEAQFQGENGDIVTVKLYGRT